MFLFLTVVQAIIAAALVGVILMQRSEGGGLGIGGSPSGMLSARGAADFLTRSTKWLAVLFAGCGHDRRSRSCRRCSCGRRSAVRRDRIISNPSQSCGLRRANGAIHVRLRLPRLNPTA